MPQPFLSDKPHLREVMNVLNRGFGRRRPVKTDPDSRRNEFNAMCCVCQWQREFENSPKASDEAMRHGRQAHGDPMLGFVRVHAR